MKDVSKFVLTVSTVLIFVIALIYSLESSEPDFIIPGKLLYRPYLDCRALGGAQVLELKINKGLFHIRATCGSGLIYNYVYTAEGEQAPGEVPNLDPGIFEQLERAVK